ncbi:unnamed protein product [Blepharisma stoltei]|uniref:Uncharacterized protein n=1 Tax=Blepharisma stoltei TaxID=1481888 RepID=A0AAU9J6T4_9CILI|nr:unnamed protein product [Blepharisma stoltei]
MQSAKSESAAYDDVSKYYNANLLESVQNLGNNFVNNLQQVMEKSLPIHINKIENELVDNLREKIKIYTFELIKADIDKTKKKFSEDFEKIKNQNKLHFERIKMIEDRIIKLENDYKQIDSQYEEEESQIETLEKSIQDVLKLNDKEALIDKLLSLDPNVLQPDSLSADTIDALLNKILDLIVDDSIDSLDVWVEQICKVMPLKTPKSQKTVYRIVMSNKNNLDNAKKIAFERTMSG